MKREEIEQKQEELIKLCKPLVTFLSTFPVCPLNKYPLDLTFQKFQEGYWWAKKSLEDYKEETDEN